MAFLGGLDDEAQSVCMYVHTCVYPSRRQSMVSAARVTIMLCFVDYKRSIKHSLKGPGEHLCLLQITYMYITMILLENVGDVSRTLL